MDLIALLWSSLFAGWLAFDWFGPSWASVLDFVFFTPLGVGVGLTQIWVARTVTERRERLAWFLLAASSFSRFVSGSVWGLWTAQSLDDSRPVWLVVLTTAYLVFLLPALLAFAGVKWRRADRLRFRLDAAIVMIGSLLVVWFFALGPFFRATGTLAPQVHDWIYTLGDSLAVVLSAALYLRSGTRFARTVAVMMLLACTLQVIPDIAFWSAQGQFTYRAGDWIAAVWYAVWSVKWLAARYAWNVLASRNVALRTHDGVYHSGYVPHAFLAAASLVLLYLLASGERHDNLLFALGSGLLAALLVAREMVEIRERNRLLRDQTADAAWHRALLHHAYDFVVLMDEEGRTTYASPSSLRLLGYGMPLGEPWGLLEAVHSDDHAVLRDAIAEVWEAPRIASCRVRGVDGEWHTLSLRLQDLRSDPLVAAIVINGLDRTRETRLATRLRETEDVEALGVFASGLAHDLNNVLTVIQAHVEMLQLDPPRTPQEASDLAAIRGETTRASALTRGLLSLSRRKSSPREPIDVGAVVRERVRLHLRAKVWPLAVRAVPGTVRGDAQSIRQAVDALLNEFGDQQPAAAEPRLSLTTCDIDDNDAGRLQLEPGCYVRLAVEGRAITLEVPHAPATPRPDTGDWDSSPDDLEMLLALAAVREFGGTIVRERAGGMKSSAMYLPVGAA
ncbi:MAG: histidine kinase dimerization/phospho-acceptor domain-containing protein [Gemmatimonadaceae bacterium]